MRRLLKQMLVFLLSVGAFAHIVALFVLGIIFNPVQIFIVLLFVFFDNIGFACFFYTNKIFF